jgi:regulatory protein
VSDHDATGGESDRLAPVIPLFGGSAPTRPLDGARASAAAADSSAAAVAGAASTPTRFGRTGTSPRSEGSDGNEWHRTWRDDSARPTHITASSADDSDDSDDDADGSAAAAEAALLRKLRARSLSVQEARTVLGGHGLAREQSDAILDEMSRLGYLDDRALAEQLVHAGQERRGQGRQAIAQTLSKRGVPRDVADAALEELPDDDMERALEFARKKASGIGGRDGQAELRRLAGQLARRGYPSHVALSAARQALDER